MTRMQIKQRRRAMLAVVIALSFASIVVSVAITGWNAEAFKTACSGVGALAISYGIMRVALLLDGEG